MPEQNKKETIAFGKLGRVPQRLIDAGFVLALLLSATCLVISAVYLFTFLSSTNDGIGLTLTQTDVSRAPVALETAVNGRLVMGRLGLLSCGILVGIAFGFLGFALFLIGIRESVNLDLETNIYKAKFAQMSPGVVIILCSAILVGVCATRETPFWYDHSTTPGRSNASPTTRNSDSNQRNDVNSEELPAKDKLTKP